MTYSSFIIVVFISIPKHKIELHSYYNPYFPANWNNSPYLNINYIFPTYDFFPIFALSETQTNIHTPDRSASTTNLPNVGFQSSFPVCARHEQFWLTLATLAALLVRVRHTILSCLWVDSGRWVVTGGHRIVAIFWYKLGTTVCPKIWKHLSFFLNAMWMYYIIGIYVL